MLQAVLEFLADHSWANERTEDGRLRLVCEGQNGRWEMVVQVDDERQQIIVSSLLPAPVRRSALMDMAELVCRVNADLVVGCFDYHIDDLQIVFRTALELDGAGLSKELLAGLFFPNVVTMDQVMPRLLSLCDVD